MKKLLITTMCLFLSLTSFSQTPEQMEAWKANMTPGVNHAWLASMNGDWDATVTMWTDPSQPPNISKASTKNEMLYGGLYQRSQHNGNMMGMPFMGESITAYDNFKKHFIATWIDNFGSSIMYMTGTLNAEGDTLTLEGSMLDPATGIDMQVKQVNTKTSKDSYKFTMYMVVDGKDIKNMEIVYSRKK